MPRRAGTTHGPKEQQPHVAGANPSHGTMASLLLGHSVVPALQKNPVWLFLRMRNFSQGQTDKFQEEHCYSLKKKK